MNILIVIVLYKQRLQESTAYMSLSQARNKVLYNYKFYIHDNSPDNLNIQDDDIYHVFHPENPGLSFAFNRAAEYAKKNNFDWLLLSDQDTYYPPGILREYEQVINNNPEIKLIVPKVRTKRGHLLSPCKYVHKRGSHLRKINSGKQLLMKLSVINSGMMINVDAFFRCGGYNEKTAIDLSDHQFIERYKKIECLFWVLEGEIFQDYSNENLLPNIMYNRFLHYIEAVKNCERENRMDNIDYFFLLLRRALALTIRTKQVRFLKIFYTEFLCKRQTIK